MTQRVEIKCINKSDRQNRHERIQNIGGINPDGSQWQLSEDKAIGYIDDGTYSFWTKGGGEETNVIVVKHSSGRRYLKTEADTTTKDNLLSLPECP